MFDYEPCILPRRKNGEGLLKHVTMLKERNFLQFLLQLCFLLRRNVLEGRAVGTEVETNKFHDALATHNIASEVTDDVDDLLRIIL